MNKYKATEGTLSYIFNTKQECDTFIASNPTFVKGIYEVSINEHYAQIFQQSLQFGQQLINTFLLDNWQSPISINAEQSVNLLNKFEVIIKLCNLGDIKNVKVLLENTQVDDIFTQERKDKYLEQIKNHLK